MKYQSLLTEPSQSAALLLCCSVAQCGGYVLMPHILAEGSLSSIYSSVFNMVPGQLAKKKVPV